MEELTLLGEDVPNSIFSNWIDNLRTEYGYFVFIILKKDVDYRESCEIHRKYETDVDKNE